MTRCEHCGGEFAPRREGQRFCTHICYSRDFHGVPPTRVCRICGEDFPTESNNWLCQGCREARDLIQVVRWPRRAAYSKVSRGRAAVRLSRAPKRRSFVAGSCPCCGENFVALAWTGSRYCSLACGKKIDRQRYRDRRRSAQGATVVFRRKVFERDGWCCRLCGKPVDRAVEVPEPLAATVDHILPLALGGEHAYCNVQTAHFLCNSTKSDHVVQLHFAA